MNMARAFKFPFFSHAIIFPLSAARLLHPQELFIERCRSEGGL